MNVTGIEIKVRRVVSIRLVCETMVGIVRKIICNIAGLVKMRTVEVELTKYSILFFKQKTAYEVEVRLVGSDMCVRDS